MILYHRTSRPAAQAIIRGGFRDAAGCYGLQKTTRGVWFSDRPLGMGEGAFGDVLLRIIMPIAMKELRRFEWIEAKKPYHEWQLPAALVNSRQRRIVALPAIAW